MKKPEILAVTCAQKNVVLLS